MPPQVETIFHSRKRASPEGPTVQAKRAAGHEYQITQSKAEEFAIKVSELSESDRDAAMDASLKVWESSYSFQSLVSNNLAFIKNQLFCTPLHLGPLALESNQIRESLVSVAYNFNVLTVDSQPSETVVSKDQSTRDQRGYLDCFVCSPGVSAKDIAIALRAVGSVDFLVISPHSGACFEHKAYYDDQVVTRVKESGSSEWAPRTWCMRGGIDDIVESMERYSTPKYRFCKDLNVISVQIVDSDFGEKPDHCIKQMCRALEAIESSQ